MLCVLEQNEFNIAAKLYEACFKVNAVMAKDIIEGFANTVYAFKENVEILGILCAARVNVNEKSGLLLHGGAILPTHRHKGIFKALLLHAVKSNPSDFFIVNNTDNYESFYAELGFKRVCTMRSFMRQIKRNLWAKASFDTITAKKLYEYRKKYIVNNYTQLSTKQLSVLLSQLYSSGISTAETENAYALYYRLQDKLLIAELYAQSDTDAWYLLEAIADKNGRNIAELVLSGENTVFSGEGSRFYSTMALGLEINELQYSGYTPE